MTKNLDDYFADWESDAFGFGYGSGEEHIIGAVREFFGTLENGRSYDYRVLEAKLGPTVTWLLINALCKCKAIEYGTAPRMGWLTPGGKALRDYIMERDVMTLVLTTSRNEDYIHCYPDVCNCRQSPKTGPVCPNPFWGRA